jgi:carboxypeptidase D
MTEHVFQFLQKFLLVFSDFNNSHFFIGGESFAGQYVPYIAEKILDSDILPLRGILIGNGWIDPQFQYPSAVKYSVTHNIVSDAFLKKSNSHLAKCMLEMRNAPNLSRYSVCEKIFNDILDSTKQE